MLKMPEKLEIKCSEPSFYRDYAEGCNTHHDRWLAYYEQEKKKWIELLDKIFERKDVWHKGELDFVLFKEKLFTVMRIQEAR